MNNEFYDVEKADKILNKAVGCYCPHCGELSYNTPFPRRANSLIYGPVRPRYCDACGKRMYGKFYLFLLHLVAVALIPITGVLFKNIESIIPAVISAAIFVLIEVASLVLSLVDHPRTYYTTLRNQYEFGRRIYLKPNNSLHINRFYREGQMYEIRCADISVEGVAVGQAECVMTDIIVLRIVKKDNLEFDIGQNVSVEPLIGKKIYAMVCDQKVK